MADVVGEHHGERKWKKYETPAAVRSYYLRVLKPEIGATGVRSGREMKTLCTALDMLAQGKNAEAADILTHRLKAVHMAMEGGHWGRADHVELVPSDQVGLNTLVGQDMANQDFSCYWQVGVFSRQSLRPHIV